MYASGSGRGPHSPFRLEFAVSLLTYEAHEHGRPYMEGSYCTWVSRSRPIRSESSLMSYFSSDASNDAVESNMKYDITGFVGYARAPHGKLPIG